MFCVIYEFDVIPSKESDFKQLWHDVTMAVKAHDGGLGSRLHKAVGHESKWIAYAQWPSRDAWLDRAPLTLNTEREKLVNQMKSTCHTIKTLLELEVIDDLLVPYSSTIKG